MIKGTPLEPIGWHTRCVMHPDITTLLADPTHKIPAEQFYPAAEYFPAAESFTLDTPELDSQKGIRFEQAHF